MSIDWTSTTTEMLWLVRFKIWEGDQKQAIYSKGLDATLCQMLWRCQALRSEIFHGIRKFTNERRSAVDLRLRNLYCVSWILLSYHRVQKLYLHRAWIEDFGRKTIDERAGSGGILRVELSANCFGNYSALLLAVGMIWSFEKSGVNMLLYFFFFFGCF